jgi:hypothetical protein
MKVGLIGVAVFVAAMFALSSWSSNKTAEANQEMGVSILPSGVRIYEVTYDGATYVVVEKGRALGITKK